MSNNVYANEADALEMARPANNETDEGPTLADFPGSTPGPWHQEAPEIDGKVSPIYRRITAGDGCGHAEFGYCGFTLTGYIHESDARLLAAAPELRDALRKVYEALMSDPPHGPQKHVGPDDVIYCLDGQRMYHAINAARDALALVRESSANHGVSHD